MLSRRLPTCSRPIIRAAVFLVLCVLAPLSAGFVRVNTNGFGSSDNQIVQAMRVFGSGLYAGTFNWNTGSQIWATTNGHSWSLRSQTSNGFGTSANQRILSFCSFNGLLYASSENTLAGSEIWRTADGAAWAIANVSGFSDINNTQITLFSNNGRLFAGCDNTAFGGNIRVSTLGTPASWTVVTQSLNGFGDFNNRGIVSFRAFNGMIYCGTWNFNGSQIYRSADGTNWLAVPAAMNGFGVAPVWPYPQRIHALEVFKGSIYAGCDEGSIWRSPDGVTWQQVRTPSGFGFQPIWQIRSNAGALWIATRNPMAGRGELLTSSTGDPSSWVVVNDDGWGDWNNSDNESLEVYKSGLFVGNQNWGPGGAIYSDLVFDYLVATNWAPLPDQFAASGTTNVTALALIVRDFYGHRVTSLRLRNQGTASNRTDITNLKIWYDTDKNGLWSPADLPASGSAVYSNVDATWRFAGLSLRTGTNLLLTVNLAKTARTNRTFRAFIYGGLDRGWIVCTNAGSSIASVSNSTAIVVGPHAYSVSKLNEIPSTNIGYPGVATVLSFEVSDSAGHGVSVVGISNLGTMSSSSDVSILYLYYDVNSDGRFSSVTDQYAAWIPYSSADNKWIFKASPPFTPPLPSNTNYIVVFYPANQGLPGRTFRAEIPLAGLQWSDGAFNTAPILNNGSLTRIDDIVPVKLGDLPQTNVFSGSVNQSCLFFHYVSFYFETNYYGLDFLKVSNTGTAQQGQDISAVRLWRDAAAPFGRYNAGDAFIAAGVYFALQGYWQFNLDPPSVYPGTNYLVTFDCAATARSNKTFRACLPAGGLQSSWGVPSHVAITNDWSETIKNTNHLVFVKTNHLYTAAFYAVTSNVQNREVLAFRFSDTKSTHSLKRLALINLGTMSAGADVAALRVWRDFGATGRYDPGIDTAAGVLTWDPGSLQWTNFGLALPEGSDVLVTIDTAPSLTAGRTFQSATRATNSIVCSSGKAVQAAITNDDVLVADLLPPPPAAALNPGFGAASAIYISWLTVWVPDVAGYEIAYDTVSHPGWNGYAYYTNSTATNFIIPGLTPGQTWYIRVRPKDYAGNAPSPTPESQVATASLFSPVFYRMNSDGFGFGGSVPRIGAQRVFRSNLYAACQDFSGTKIFRTSGGATWQQVNQTGFGDMNNVETRALVAYNNRLFAGTFGMGASGPEIWETTDGTAWTRRVDGGIGDASQRGILAMTTYNTGLYAGCENSGGFPQGADLWSSLNGTNWFRSAPKGLGNLDNSRISSFGNFQSRLYAGTANWNGGQLYSSPDGTNWTLVTASTNGFGNLMNQEITALATVSNRLLAGTYNGSTGCEIWSSRDATNWTLIVPRGFCDAANVRINRFGSYSNYLWVAMERGFGAVQTYRTKNLTNWQKFSPDGFGDENNYGLASSTVFRSNLFVGTANWNGGQEWSDRADRVTVVKLANVPSRSGLPGSVNNPVLDFTVRDTYAAPFSGLTVRNFGSMTTNDIAAVKLWYDTDKNARWSAVDKALGFPAVWNPITSRYDFLLLSGLTWTNLLVTVDLKPMAVTNRTFIASIATNAVAGFGGFRNTDTAVTNYGALFVGATTLYAPVFTVTSNLRPVFTWSADPSVDTNRIMISTNNFASVLVTASVLTTNYTPVVNLRNGTNWWRVRVHVAASTNWFQSSTVWFIVDRTPPSPSAPVAPASNAWATNGNSVRLIWRTSTDAYGLAGYEAQITTNFAFSSFIGGFAPAPMTNVPAPVLADGTWFWRIRPRDAAGNNAAWTPVWSIRVDSTDPSVPVLLVPRDLSYTNANPRFAWNKSADLFSGVSNYRIEIASNAGFAPLNTSADTAATQFQRGTPLADGVWWWRVQSVDRAGNRTGWSAVRQVTVDTAPPAAPNLLLPGNGTATNTTLPLLVWSRAADFGPAGMSNYRLVMSSNNWISTQRAWLSPTAVVTQFIPPALGNGLWSWEVGSIDKARNASAWSAVRTLRVDTVSPPAPNLSYPPNGKYTNNNHPQFGWAAVADPSGILRYEIVFNGGAGIDVGNNTNWTFGPGIFVDGNSNWRVRAVDNAGNVGPVSGSRVLIVNITIPSTPVPVSPADGALTNDSTPDFLWNQSTDTSGIKRYEIMIGTSIFNVGNATNWSYPTAWVDGSSNWQVRSFDNANNPSLWSAVRSLTVDTTAPPAPGPILPADAVLTNDNTPSFLWTRSSDPSGIKRYEIMVGSTIYSAGTATNWTYGPGVFVDGASNWQTRALDNAGNPSAWSILRSLVVDTAGPAAPVLLLPPNAVVTNLNKPVFRWNRSADASGVARYELRIGADTYDMGTATNWIYGPGTWVDGTSNWTVRAVDNAENAGPYAVSRTLGVDATPPTAVGLDTPASNIAVPALVADLKWFASSDALSGVAGYMVQFDDNQAFSSPAAKITNGLLWHVTGLVNAVTNWWRVRAFDNERNTNAWSSAWRFSSDTNQIITALYTPANGLLTNNATPGFVWSADPAASRSWIELRTNNLAGRVVASNTNVAATNIALGAVNDGVYFWRVRAFKTSTSQWQTWSAGNVFTIDTSAPPAPNMLSPLDAALTNDVTPSFRWSHVTDPYGILRYEIGFNGTVYTAGSLTNWTYGPGFCIDGTSNWRVRAVDNAGNPGAWSALRSLSIDAILPPAPVLRFPSDALLTNDNTPLFIWSKSPDASGIRSYEIGIGPTVYDAGTATNWTYGPGIFADGASNWRVRAVDNAGNIGSWSAVRALTILTVSPAAPLLVSPAAAAYSPIDQPWFTWNRVVAAVAIDRYEIQIGFSIFDAGTATNWVYPFNWVDSASNWRVRAVDSAGNIGAWSVSRSLTVDMIPPSDPVPLAPFDTALTNDATPGFLWTRVTDSGSPIRYEIRFQGNAAHDTGTLTNWIYGPGSFVDGTSNWEVRTIDAASNAGNWVAGWDLTVDTTPPAAPSPLAPADGGITNDTTPSFSWNASVDPAGIMRYEVEFNSTVYDAGAGLSWTYGPGVCVDGSSNWRVRAVDNAGNPGAWSGVRSLTIDSTPPSLVVLQTPVSNSLVTSISVALGWNASVDLPAGVAGYRIEVAQDPSFTGSQTRTTNGLSWNVTLADGSTNWWRVAAFDTSHNTNAWSAVWNVRIDTNQIVPVLLTPANTSITDDSTPSYAWTASAGASRFWIEVRTNDLSGKVIASNTNVIAPPVGLGALPDGSYFWRVKAWKTVSAQWQVWSGGYSFIVDTLAPPVPGPVHPLPGALTNFGSPVFVWTSVKDANSVLRYEVGINSTVYNAGSLTNWTYPSTFVDGISNWQVRAVDTAGNTGAWSAARSLAVDTAGPVAPGPISPSSGLVTSDATPAFLWSSVTDPNGISRYEIGFNGTVYTAGSLTNWTYGPGFCVDGTSNWRVRAVDNAGNPGTWSAFRTLTIDGSVPTVPVVLGPANGTVTNDSTPSFFWNKAGDANGIARYELMIATTIYTTSATNWTYPSVWVDGSSNWRIRAVDNAGNPGAWSAFSTLSVDTTAPAVAILGPAVSDATNDSTPIFSWNGATDPSGILRYEVLFNGTLYNAGPSTNWTYGPGSSVDGTSNWQVRAVDNRLNAGPWSGARQLTIDTTAPSVPVLVLPVSNTVFVSGPVDLSWSASVDSRSGIAGYTVEVGNSNFSVIARTIQCSSNQTNLTVAPALPGGQWFWRVRAADRAGNASPFSPGWSFTLPSVNAPESDLKNVRGYPNPLFSGETLRVDRLTLNANIEIYSVTGVRVFPTAGGPYSVTGFDGNPVDTWTPLEEASGVYILVAWNDKGSVTRRIVYLKATR